MSAVIKESIQILIETCLCESAAQAQTLSAAFPQVFPPTKLAYPVLQTPIHPQISAVLAPDVEYRLREVIQESLKWMKHSKRTKLTTADINKTLSMHHGISTFGFSTSKEPLLFRRTVNNQNLFFIDDKELDFNHILNAPLPPTPKEPSLQIHWLAVEGEQPLISQNVTSAFKKSNFPSFHQIKPLVKHVLSKELQMYFDQISKTLKNGNKQDIKNCYAILKKEKGISVLVPYLIQLVFDETFMNLKNCEILIRLVGLINCLIDNPHLTIEPYAHQCMPVLLTCLVGESFSNSPLHFSLRILSSSVLEKILKKNNNTFDNNDSNNFNSLYFNLSGRISSSLLEIILDQTKPFSSYFGALEGFKCLSSEFIGRYLLCHLNFIVDYLENTHKNEKKNDNQHITQSHLEKEKCYEVLLSLCLKFIQSDYFKKTGIYYQDMTEIFGEKLIPCLPNPEIFF